MKILDRPAACGASPFPGSPLVLVIVLGAWLFTAAAPASAQPLGVFRWQMQPYCNVVTFTVIAQGPAYQLTGADDLCGAAAAAPATGTAVQNPDGTIAMGFAVVNPGGASAHINATISMPSVAGSWRDADEHTGAFVFNPGSAGGPRRPEPTRPALITSAQLAASIFAGTGSATTIARSDHDHDSRYAPGGHNHDSQYAPSAHNHDSRYFTQAQTFTQLQTTALVAASRTSSVAVTGQSLPSLSPQELVEPVSVQIPAPGRLLITRAVNLTFACSSGDAAYIFLVVDGTPVYASTLRIVAQYSGPLIGVTTTSVGAGSRTIAVGLQCAGGTLTSYGLYPGFSSTSVVVLP